MLIKITSVVIIPLDYMVTEYRKCSMDLLNNINLFNINRIRYFRITILH